MYLLIVELLLKSTKSHLHLDWQFAYFDRGVCSSFLLLQLLEIVEALLNLVVSDNSGLCRRERFIQKILDLLFHVITHFLG